jgi:hypothetical protein
MAAYDIMPFTAAVSRPVLTFRMGALTTDGAEDTSWNVGEVLRVEAAVGDINEHTDGAADPSDGTYYLAAAGSAELILANGGTSGADTHDIYVPVYDMTQGDEFVTANVVSGDDTQLALTVAAGVVVGVTGDLWTDDAAAAHVHNLDIGGNFFVITRRLDALGRDADISGAACTRVVFKAKSGAA